VTLERPDLVRHLTTVHGPRKAPVVLSQEEVASESTDCVL
jgi:integrase/recombinase XerD